MNIRKSLSLSSVAVGLVFCVCGYAQEPTQPTISTDRPSVGTGTDLVPKHWVVAENGVSFTAPGGTPTIDGPENLLRVGAFTNVELRFSSPSLQKSSGVSGVQRQDASFGAKIRIPSAKAWPLSGILTLSTPVGSPEVSSGGWDPAAMLAASHSWGPRLSTSASANFASISGVGRGREQADQFAVSQICVLSNKATAYVEFAPLLSHDPQISSSTSDAGVTWLVGQRVQLDVRGGATRDSSGIHPVAGVGYSVLFRGFR